MIERNTSIDMDVCAENPPAEQEDVHIPGSPKSEAAELASKYERKRPLVAVLGGSFDPITDAHLKAASEIIHSQTADRVWIIPCGARPDKASLKTSPLDRLIMCHLAVDTMFGSRFPMEVKDIELPLKQAAPTLHLIRKLEAMHPELDFAFVIGTDLVESMDTWGCPAVPEWGCDAIPTRDAGPMLFREAKFVVINRPGYVVPAETRAKMGRNFVALTPLTGTTLVTQRLSSSEIRTRIRSNDQQFELHERSAIAQGNFAMVEGLMPPAVLAHIIRNNLYTA